MQMLEHTGLFYSVKLIKIFNFSGFGVEHVPKEIKNLLDIKA